MEFYNYPTGKVILSYALLGGPLGGFILVGLFKIFDLISPNSIVHSIPFQIDSITLIRGFFSLVTLGIIVGMIPSLLTGCAITKLRFFRKNLSSYFHVFAIGFLITVLFVFLINLVLSDFKLFNNPNLGTVIVMANSMILFGITGGLSSVIVGQFVLPKS